MGERCVFTYVAIWLSRESEHSSVIRMTEGTRRGPMDPNKLQMKESLTTERVFNSLIGQLTRTENNKMPVKNVFFFTIKRSQ